MGNVTDDVLAFDRRSTDWSQVARIVCRVREHYRYTYTDAVRDLKQQLAIRRTGTSTSGYSPIAWRFGAWTALVVSPGNTIISATESDAS